MYSKPVPLPPEEEWYYELDGRTHGPMSRVDLEELLDRSGETADEVRVRRGPDVPWSPFRTVVAVRPAARSLSESSVAVLASGGRATSQCSGSSLASARPAGFFQRAVLAAIGIWVLLNVLLISFWPEPHSRERRYLQTLRTIDREKQMLRAKPATDSEWQQFAERARTTLAPIVKDLKNSASAAQPVRQQLFWSARALIPRTLGPRTKERDNVEQQLKQYLDTVERELGELRT